jgi:hypothetical protein
LNFAKIKQFGIVLENLKLIINFEECCIEFSAFAFKKVRNKSKRIYVPNLLLIEHLNGILIANLTIK